MAVIVAEDLTSRNRTSGGEQESEAVDHGMQPPCRLDEEAFPAFAALLSASQGYVEFSGCRFSMVAFDGIEYDASSRMHTVSEQRSCDAGPLLAAKLRAAAQVRSFAERLQQREPELAQDLDRAFDVVMKESARNTMIAACKELEIFPPPVAPFTVDDSDCSWEDTSAPLLFTAQRLYNDEAKRLIEIVTGENPARRSARTASCIVEFADEVGVEVPKLSQAHTEMLRQFDQKVSMWQASPEGPGLITTVFEGVGDLASKLRNRTESCITEKYLDATEYLKDQANEVRSKAAKMEFDRKSQEAPFWGLAAIGAVGVAGTVGAIAVAGAYAAKRRSSK
jgi:hypothetical protein